MRMFVSTCHLCLLLIALLFPASVFAQASTVKNNAADVTVMPQITVSASRIAPTTGTTIIDKEMIDNLPKRNGSINEIIGIVPGVQYGEGSLHSFTGGEITPPPVSISGSRFYDNNYTIDGISNNSALDPANQVVNDASKLPGHPQMQFLDPHVIDQITVYNSNIPAEFGNFTGGQIDVKTIEPADYFWGNINYRTTRDTWSKFYIDPDDKDSFYHSNTKDKQPSFQKHIGGLTLNIPLSDSTAIATSYQQTFAKIPLLHLDDKNNQSRREENFFFKLAHLPLRSTRLSLTAIYSPSANEYFLKDFKTSGYRISTEGYTLSGQVEKDTAAGTVGLTIGYNAQNKKRTAAKDRFFWNASTPSIDWNSGKEGSLGQLETVQEDLSLKTDFSFKSLQLKQTAHLLKLGAEATYSYQHYKRPETSYYYYSPALYSSTPFTCTSGDPACIDSEQYLTRRTVYKNADMDAEVADYAVYLQDAIAWDNLELFPGLRLSYDNLTGNKNLAPRFSASYDLFGDRGTVLFAGRNRYYSGTLLTHILYQAIDIENQVRTTADNSDASWSSSTSYTYVNSDVKTPYTDETTAGVIQRVFGGQLKLQYIYKNSRDEFARERNSALKQYLLNNNGRSEHKSLQADWQRAWKNHFFEINATWQKTTTSNIDYSAYLNPSDLTETIWYEGQELNYDELPRTDFNRPLVVNLIYTGKFPHNITFTNTTKYRGPYSKLKNTAQKQQSVIDPSQDSWIYEKVRNKSSIIFDWRLSWQIPALAQQQAVLSVDIYNVFDHKVPVGSLTDEFELGRQFWAGLEYNF